MTKLRPGIWGTNEMGRPSCDDNSPAANRGRERLQDPAVRVRPGLDPMVTQQIARVATEAPSPPAAAD